jgi:hypothetical protein
MIKTKKHFEVLDGKQPILISAPHVYAHKRPNLSLSYKQGEPCTDYIARHIAEESNANAIYSTTELDYDPNYFKILQNDYKHEVNDLIKKKKIKYFFDIHGLSDEYPYDFGIYYLNKYNKSKNLAYGLAQSLNNESLRHCLIQILNIQTGSAETLTEFTASKLKVASLQIEISRYIREDEILRESLIANFCDFLSTLY